MEMQASKSPHPLVWVAAIALIVFCGAGAAALMGWIPTSAGKPGDDAALAKLDKPHASPARAAPAKTHPAAVVAAKCAECGVVQSVHEVDVKGEGSGVGVVGGAVAGGVLGHQVGNGDGQTIATVIGAVGGGFAGNEIEKRVKSKKSYEVTVRFDDGSSRVITEVNAPAWRSGDKVKVINGVIQSNA
jgi:outer membrane lipoprotein SlyB